MQSKALTKSSNKELIWDKVIGKIKFVGNDDFHLYEFESGKRQSSVTTKNIMEKSWLPDYAVRKAFEYLESQGFSNISPINRDSYLDGALHARTEILRDASNNVGTPSHHAIERYCLEWVKTGILPKDITEFIEKKFVKDDATGLEKEVTDPRIYASVRSAEKWLRKMEDKINPLFVEIIVGDERYSAGMIDFVFEFKESGDLYILDWKTSNQINDDYALQASAYAKFLEHMIGRPCGAFIAHLSKQRDSYEIYEVKNIAKNYTAFKSMCKLYDWKYAKFDKLKKDITIYDARTKGTTQQLRKC